MCDARSISSDDNFLLPPANEVCEGYVFTGVCLSMGRGVWVSVIPGTRGRHPPGRHSTWSDTPLSRHPLGRHPLADGQQAGGTHPTGMHSCYICLRAIHVTRYFQEGGSFGSTYFSVHTIKGIYLILLKSTVDLTDL